MDQGQSSDATGTRDETYDVISIVYHALQGAENCDIYADDAEKDELRQFFQQAGDQQRQLTEQGKRLLAQCLQREGGQSGEQSGGSAFFGGQQGQGGSQQTQGATAGSVSQTDTGIG